jgi:serine protease Do
MRACPVSQRLLRRDGLRIATLVVAILSPALGQTAKATSEEARRTPVVEAVRKVQPCVVSITSEKKAASSSRWPFSHEENQRPRVSGMGTGVLVDGRGYILTNYHVVDKVQGIEIHLHDGTVHPARLVQQDEGMDLAMLKVDAGRPLPAVAIGSSSDLMVGEQVITIGNAFGYENTVSVGIVSALNRNVTLSDEQVYRNLIQTDACINPGNSGGPLINIDGELIGINVAVRAGAQGIGFALPIDDVKRVAVEMLSTRRLAGTWHGLVTGETKSGSVRSVIVSDISSGSPAEVAGLQRGDQVLKVGEFAVTTPLDIERGLLDSRPGAKNDVLVRRGGQDKVVSLELQPLPRASGDAGDRIWKTLGVRTVPVTRDYVKNVVPDRNGGLWVQAVQPGSPAERASIQKGDILIGMSYGAGGWETTQLDNVLYILKRPEAGQAQPLQCWVVRRNELIKRVMPVAEAPYANARR